MYLLGKLHSLPKEKKKKGENIAGIIKIWDCQYKKMQIDLKIKVLKIDLLIDM